MQGFIMLADVPADGYSVELGQLESPEKRGQVKIINISHLYLL
jgi:hypothetical protein